jgi:membrane protease YdiL (CAAX protease family)
VSTTPLGPIWDQRPRGAHDPRGPLLIAVYASLWLSAVIGLNVVAALVMMAGQGLTDQVAMPPWMLVGLLTLQFPLMVGLLPVAHRWVDRLWERRRGVSMGPWQHAPLRPLDARWWGIAAVAGLCTGWTSGLVATWMRQALPFLGEGSLEAINEALTQGWWPWRAAMVVLIVVAAPVAEELVFRDYMWRALARFQSPRQVWVWSSVIFAFYHLDPVQSVSLLPTALVLGWLRLHAGTITPCIVVHLLNNALGVGALYWWGPEADIPVLFIFGTGLCALAACGAAWRWSSLPAAVR